MKKMKSRKIGFICLISIIAIVGMTVLFVPKKNNLKTIETNKKETASKENPTNKRYICGYNYSQTAYGVDPNAITATVDDNNIFTITGLPTSDIKVIVTNDLSENQQEYTANQYKYTEYYYEYGHYQEFTNTSTGVVSEILTGFSEEDMMDLYYVIVAATTKENPPADDAYIADNDTVEVEGCVGNDINHSVIASGTVTYKDSTEANDLANPAECERLRARYAAYPNLVEAIPYCDATGGYTQGMIDSIVKSLEDVFQLYEESKNQQTLTYDPGVIQVEDPNKEIKLYCDAYNATYTDENQVYPQENKRVYQTIKEEEVNQYCSVTCKETVEVNFQEPIKTQAGLCFSYQVEVKSKVECSTKINQEKIPKKPEICSAVPICNHHPRSVVCLKNNGEDGCSAGGGPTEEFDACVASCDGGEYTQSCIDSCYEEVYEDETVEPTANQTNTQKIGQTEYMLNYNNSAKAVQILSKEIKKKFPDYDLSTFEGVKPTYKKTDGSYLSAQEVYDFRKAYPGGRYNYKAKTWEQEGPVKSAFGYYYFATLKRTKSTITLTRRSYNEYQKHKTEPREVRLKYRPAEAADGGFKKATIRVSDDPGSEMPYQCAAQCKWTEVSAACDSDNPIMTTQQQKEAYQKQVAAFETAVEECSSYSRCNTTTSSYTIDVDKGGMNETHFEASMAPGNSAPSGKKKGDENILIEYGGKCYYDGSTKYETGNTEENSKWWYRDVLSFPQRWEDVKSGLTTTIPPKDKDAFLDFGNTFCTNKKTPFVNEEWYNWKVFENGNTDSVNQLKQTFDDGTSTHNGSRKDNINFHIGSGKNLWGHFGWNIDINCFYAIGGTEDPNDPNSGGGCTGDDCPPLVQDYTFRTVSLNNLFPGQGQSETREPRYNWSCSATNTTNTGYPVQPNATIERIQAAGDSIFNNDDEYLDYEITLDKQTRNIIDNYEKTHKGYMDYDDAAIKPVKEGVTAYTSSLLDSLRSAGSMTKRGTVGCNDDGQGGCHTAVTDDPCYQLYNK